MVDIALYQPDIAANLGAQIRLAACMGVGLHVIEPCGFPWNERKIKQSAMDYINHVKLMKYSGWDNFNATIAPRRLVLLTTHADLNYTDFHYEADDILLLGTESSGAPQNIHDSAASRIAIPMADGLRSLNIVNATSMILGEALRQTRWRK